MAQVCSDKKVPQYAQSNHNKIKRRKNMKSKKSLLMTVFFIVTMFAGMLYTDAPAGRANAYPDRVQAGSVIDFRAESPHPVPDGWTATYNFPGAEFVRLHFNRFDLAEGDKLVISNLDGSQSWEYTGQGHNGNGNFWAFAINGADVVVTIIAPSGNSYGFEIKDVGYGTIPLEVSQPVPEIVVGTDGREDVACHLNDPVVSAAQAPVARLLFTVKRTQYLCTGELVRGSNANTLITNNHCFADQTATNTVEARFNYQYTTCGGSTLAATTSFAGGTFLKNQLSDLQQAQGLHHRAGLHHHHPERRAGGDFRRADPHHSHLGRHADELHPASGRLTQANWLLGRCGTQHPLQDRYDQHDLRLISTQHPGWLRL